MKLVGFQAKRSLFDEGIETSDLNIFIGANASGKSTTLDALRFLRRGCVGEGSGFGRGECF